MDPTKTISREELKQKMEDQEEFVLIDVLSELSYTQAHVPDAVNINLHGDDDFVTEVSNQFPDKGQEIIVYCSNSESTESETALKKLTDAGYTNVTRFAGGLKDWAKGEYKFEGEDAEETAYTLRESS